MLNYQGLSTIEQAMVDKEIDNNFNISAKNRTAYSKMKHEVHTSIRCCNCFRIVAKCCCDKIEDCFDELNDPNDSE